MEDLPERDVPGARHLARRSRYTPEELGARPTVNGDGEIEYANATTVEPDPDPEPSGAPAPPAQPEIASEAQVKALAILATKKLGSVREVRLAAYAEIIGREIETTKDLTVAEWGQCRDALNTLPDLPANGAGKPASEAEDVAGGASDPGLVSVGVPASPAPASDLSSDDDAIFDEAEPKPEKIRRLLTARKMLDAEDTLEIRQRPAEKWGLPVGKWKIHQLVTAGFADKMLAMLESQ